MDPRKVAQIVEVLNGLTALAGERFRVARVQLRRDQSSSRAREPHFDGRAASRARISVESARETRVYGKSD
jgi:hypothetical protein